jgi:hypothetical protein
MIHKGLRKLILAGCVTMSFAASGESQDCGTSIYGGVIAAGSYSGNGATCRQATDDMHDDMLAWAPICPGCTSPLVGCEGVVTLATDITVGDCHEDPITHVVTRTASVPSGGSTWDKTCTSCHGI